MPALWGAEEQAPQNEPRRPTRHFRMPRPVEAAILAAANVLALGAFCWPLVAAALPQDAAAALPYAALAIAPLAVVAVVVSLDGSVRSAHTVALLGVLAAVGSAIRVASTGVGGVEAVFILLILAGRAFGARFGMLLGAATIAVSSALWSGIGPWSPFQIFACAWVGAGAGLLPRNVRGKAELWMLCAYGVLASYVFGLLTNLWFWPFAVGAGTGISYVPGAPLSANLSSFLLYSFITSTAGWDTLRAVTTIVGIALVGRAVLAALRRAKPLSGQSGAAAEAQGAARPVSADV
jgi:energy-coupling factor transport system ATP-binding protein